MPAVEKGMHLPERHMPPFDAGTVAAYLSVSGDDNPVHTDPALAGRAGLNGIPVPGMLVMGLLGTYVEDWPAAAAVTRLHADFVSPVLVGDALTLGGKLVWLDTRTQTATLRLTAMVGGKLNVVGEADITLHEDQA